MGASEVRATDVPPARLGAIYPVEVSPGAKRRTSGEFRLSFGFLGAAAVVALVFASVLAVSLPALGTSARLIVVLGLCCIAAASCVLPIFRFWKRAGGAGEVNASERSGADSRLAQYPAGVAAASEIATRGVDARSEAVRIHLQAISDATDNLLNAHAQSFAERLGGEQVRLIEALDVYGQTLATRLNVSSVALAREFRDQGEDLRKRIEVAGGDAVTAIGRQGEATAAAMESSSHANRLRLVEAQDSLTERVQETWSRQIEQADEHRRALLATVDESANALAETTSVAAAAIAAKLEEANTSIDRVVEGALARIEARIGARIDELETRLVTIGQNLDHRWNARREEVANEFASAASAAQAAVAEEVGRLAADTAQRTKLALVEGVHDPLRNWADYAEATAQQVNAAAERASQAASASQTAIASRLNEFDNAVAARAEALGLRLQQQSQALRSALDSAEASVGQGGERLVSAVDATTRDLDRALMDRLGEADGRFSAWREAWNSDFTAHARFIDERAQSEGARIDGLVERHRAALTESLVAHGAALDRDLAAAAAAVQSQLADGERTVGTRLTAAANELSQSFLREAAGLSEALDSRGGALRDQIVARQDELIRVIQHGVAGAEARFEANVVATTQTIDAVAARVAGALDERGQALERVLAEASQSLLRIMSDGERETRSAIESSVAEGASKLDAGRRALVGSIAEAAQESANALTQGFDDHRRRLEAQVVDATEVLNRANSGFAESISRAALSTDALLTERSAELSVTLLTNANGAIKTFAEEISQQLVKLESLMEVGTVRMQREFAAPLGETLTRISEEGAGLSAATRALAESIASTSAIHRDRLHQSFAREADAFRAIVTGNAEAFHREFASALSGADDVFLSRGQDVARELGARVGELKTLLAGDGFALLKAFEARGEQVSHQIETVSQRSLGDFERKTNGLIALLTRRGDDLLSSMTAAASESARKVALVSNELQDEARRADASLRDIERKVDGMLELLDKRKSELASGLSTLPRIGQEPEPVSAALVNQRTHAGSSDALPHGRA